MKTSTPDQGASPPNALVVTGAAELEAASLHHPSPPPSVPDYELLRCIGRGSYGDVWLARNVLGQFRAVKFVYRSRFIDPRPFEREFEGIQRFEPISRSHPSQLHILHVGKNDAEACFYYVMELADDANAPVAADVRRLTSPGARVSPPAAAPNNQTVSDTSSRLPSGVAAAAGDSRAPADRGSPDPQRIRMEIGLGESARARTDVAAAAGDSRGPKSEPPHVGCYEPRTLRSDLERHGRLPPADCVQIGLSLATALGHLHEQDLVHRDIKPSNVIFVNGVAKLGDIGLVTDAGDTQSIVGTEGYLPPEGPGTPQADLYSLGKVLYEISTGLDRRRFAELPDDVWTWPDHKAVIEFNEIVLRACAKVPAQRYQTAEQLRADLALLQEGKSVKRWRSNERRRAVGKRVALAFFAFTAITMIVLSLLRRNSHAKVVDEGLPSTNQYANALCDKAMKLLGADDSIGSPEAYTNLLRAIELDPNFARAYIGLFDLRVDRFVPSLPMLAAPELHKIVTKLAEVGPGLPSTHKAQSILALEELDFPSAERHALKAIEMNPSPRVVSFYCFMLVQWGRTKEAREWLEKARAFDASGGFAYRVMGHSYYVERDFTNAIAWYRKAITWEPRQAAAYNFIGSAYLAMRDFTNGFANKALADILWGSDEFKTKQKYDRYRDTWATRGERGYWEERLKQMKEDPNSDHVSMARVQIQLAETNAAIRSLEECYEKRERVGMESLLIYLVFDECWDGLRGDRRFQELLDKIGFTKVMRNGKN